MKRILSNKRGLDILSRFDDSCILVIGDIMVDEFIWGRVSRISPEAPVPVVDVAFEYLRLGGATNVVNNIHSLEGEVLVCGVIGDDEMGGKLISDLTELGIDTDGIIAEEHRQTTVKTRVIAHNQQVVRYDREDVAQVRADTLERIISYLSKNMDRLGAIILSDYGKGVISEQLIKEVLRIAKANGKITSVDPKVDNFPYYRDVTLITPNNDEASQASGIHIGDEDTLIRAGELLLKRLACQLLLITRGEEGMTLFEKDGEITHIPTLAQEVYDVTGAGDTVISVMTMALTCGATLKEAAAIANYAAGIVVGELGTATVNRNELMEAIKKNRVTKG